MRLLRRHTPFFLLCIGLLTLLALVACGATTTTGTASSSTAGQSKAATATPLIAAMKLVDSPTVKVTGNTFTVTGHIKNGDTYQHDIFVQAVLLDASGAVLGKSALQNVDNVAGGATGSYTLQGTTSQPTWSKIQVSVVKVSENTNGTGND